MFENLNKRQRSILEYIIKKIRERGYPPSVREIGTAVGLSSSSTVHKYLTQLENLGYIRKDPSKPRTIEVLHGRDNIIAGENNEAIIIVPVVGNVKAGQPVLAVENIEESFPFPKSLLRGNENVFMLEVKGESMVEAGIHNGDYVLVNQQQIAEQGDIVVALINEEATVKRFFKEKDYIRLQPENRFMEPIIVPEARILGKVIGVFRIL